MLAYLSHTLGGVNGAETVRRQDNIANALGWLSFLVQASAWSIAMPWLAYVMALREIHRPRTMVDQREMIKRCDALVLVGGEISPHMAQEVSWAERFFVMTVDLTDLGRSPPHLDVDDARELLQQRIESAARHQRT